MRDSRAFVWVLSATWSSSSVYRPWREQHAHSVHPEIAALTGCTAGGCLQDTDMCSPPDDYHITVPPPYENLDDEIYQPFPPPLSLACAQECAGKSAKEEQKIGGLLLSQMEEEAVMQRDVSHTSLDVERLVSEKGIPALWDVLHNTSFKGQGHEAEDLQIMLCKIEQWGQQLYPKESFETLISQLEDVSDHPSVQVLHRNIVTPCALSGSGGCEDNCCTMGNVVKPQKSTEDEDHPVT